MESPRRNTVDASRPAGDTGKAAASASRSVPEIQEQGAVPGAGHASARVKVRVFVLRFVPSYIAILAFFYIFGNLYSSLFFPPLAHLTASLNPDYEILSLKFDDSHQQIQYRLRIHRVVVQARQGRTLGMETTGAVYASAVYTIPILYFALFLAWPGLSLRDRGKTLLIALPLLFVIGLTDIYILLLARIEKELAVRTMTGELRTYLNVFLNNGGRQFLGLFIFIISLAPVYLRKVIAPVPAAVGRNAPCPCGSGKKYKHCCLVD